MVIQNKENNDKRFDRNIKLLMKIGHIPSLVFCIVKNNKIIFSNNYGY